MRKSLDAETIIGLRLDNVFFCRASHGIAARTVTKFFDAHTEASSGIIGGNASSKGGGVDFFGLSGRFCLASHSLLYDLFWLTRDDFVCCGRNSFNDIIAVMTICFGDIFCFIFDCSTKLDDIRRHSNWRFGGYDLFNFWNDCFSGLLIGFGLFEVCCMYT